MIEILHYLKDPKLWDYGMLLLIMGNAGCISSTVVTIVRLLRKSDDPEPQSPAGAPDVGW